MRLLNSSSFLRRFKALIFSAKDPLSCARVSHFHLEAHSSDVLYLISDVLFPGDGDLYLIAEGLFLRSCGLCLRSCGLCLRYCALTLQFLLRDFHCE
jgi:hypothetical protein